MTESTIRRKAYCGLPMGDRMTALPASPSRVDEKGRTIIPKEVREALGLLEGGHVVYEVQGKRVLLRKVKWSAE